MRARGVALRLARAAVALLLLAGAAAAQDGADAAEPAADAPVLRVDFPEQDAIPGQPLSLRLTVLVPTFMPSPPVWPTLEAPNLLVRLPEGSTNPTSERIGGETWSGITRHYRISPMVPGDFTIPAQQVRVTMADPGGDPRQVTLALEPLRFRGVVPEGAESLDPFLAARGLVLTQEIAGDPGAMSPGDSLTRTITVEVTGVSPMFVPQVLETGSVAGLAAYPAQAVVTETQDRGAVSGTRVEEIAYVAEGGGRGVLPPVTLEWYDIAAGTVQTAQAEQIDIQIDGPPAARADPRDWRMLGLWSVLALGAAALLAVALRRLGPPVRRWRARRRAAHLLSESYAWEGVRGALSARDHGALLPALDTWSARRAGPDPRALPDVAAALHALGAARFGPSAGAGGQPANSRDAWRDLDRALTKARRSANAAPLVAALPPLNPHPGT